MIDFVTTAVRKIKAAYLFIIFIITRWNELVFNYLRPFINFPMCLTVHIAHTIKRVKTKTWRPFIIFNQLYAFYKTYIHNYIHIYIHTCVSLSFLLCGWMRKIIVPFIRLCSSDGCGYCKPRINLIDRRRFIFVFLVHTTSILIRSWQNDQ